MCQKNRWGNSYVDHSQELKTSEFQDMEKVHILIHSLRKLLYVGKVLEYFLALLAWGFYRILSNMGHFIDPVYST